MHSFTGMQEACCNAERLASGDQLHANVGTLANATDDQFACSSLARQDSFDSIRKSFDCNCAGLVQIGRPAKRCSFDCEDMLSPRQYVVLDG